MHLAREAVKAFVPRRHRFALRSTTLGLIHKGNSRFCRCCRSRVRRFRSFGHRKRENAQCPVCGALERDRAVSYYLDLHPGLLTSARRVLHVAPERAIAYRLQRWDRRSYVSIDIEPGAADRVMDLTDLDFPDDSFDAVYCSNVLEHIERDREAMKEMCRVLTPFGWAMILVPLLGETTHEDLSVVDPAERERLYGQPDHVRAYGIDVAERLAGCGLDVWVEQPARGLPQEEAEAQGIAPNEVVFLCKKPGPGEKPAARALPGNFVPAYGRQPALRNRYGAAFYINPHLERLREQEAAPPARRAAGQR